MDNLNQLTFVDVLGQLTLDSIHIKQVFEYYHGCYESNGLAQQFVANCQLLSIREKQNAQIGFVDRSLGLHLPKKKTTEGESIRGTLLRNGLVRSTGHELFRGCVVFPDVDIHGDIVSANGYRIGRIRNGDTAIVQWQKPEPKSFVDNGMSMARALVHGQAYH